jgi:hypothetical protein
MDMNSDLEFMVQTDMIMCGYDPYSLIDIQLYWEELLNGN